MLIQLMSSWNTRVCVCVCVGSWLYYSNSVKSPFSHGLPKENMFTVSVVRKGTLIICHGLCVCVRVR